MPASASAFPSSLGSDPSRPRSGKSAPALSLAGVGARPQNGSNLCAATLDGSPQSPSWEGAAVVPLDRQRGAQRLVNGPSSKCSENTKLLQTVFGQGSKLSLARALAAATSSSRPTTAAALWPVRFRGCLSAHNSGGTLAASTGMIAAGCAVRCRRLRAGGGNPLGLTSFPLSWFVRLPADLVLDTWLGSHSTRASPGSSSIRFSRLPSSNTISINLSRLPSEGHGSPRSAKCASLGSSGCQLTK